MFSSYCKIALRSLTKSKAFSLINIIGLAIGMATFLLISRYVSFELSYDDFHEKSNDIYRVKTKYVRNGEIIYDAADSFAGVGPALKRELLEVREFVRLYNAGAKFNCVVSATDTEVPKYFRERQLFFADASFFDVFSYLLLTGDRPTVLLQPNTAVLSETAAKKYFGSSDPVGRMIEMKDDAGNEASFTVTGVFQDPPGNSHLQFSILLSYSTLSAREHGVERYENRWAGRDNFLTYIELAPGTDHEPVEAKIPVIVDQYKPSYTETDDRGERIRTNILTLQPLADIHLNSNLSNEAGVNGDATIVYVLAAVAVFVLLIAWMNYINLSAASLLTRMREVGLRLASGASRWQLLSRFLVEALILNAVALALAFFLLEMTLPYFRQITAKSLEVANWSASDSWIMLAVVVLCALIFGSYAAALSTRLPTAAILSKNAQGSGRGFAWRRTLIVAQFVISITLVSTTIVVFSQLQFMRKHDLGFDADQILVLQNPAGTKSTGTESRGYTSFKNDILKYPMIQDVAGSNIIPGRSFMAGLAISRVAGGSIDNIRSFNDFWVDRDFLGTYGMTFLAGRDFTGAADSSAIILSNSAALQLGFADADDGIGKDVYLFGSARHTVVGVIDDYHHEILQNPRSPTMFKLSGRFPDFISIKLSGADLHQAVTAVEAEWKKHFPGNPFDFFFLDDHIMSQYRAFQRLGELFFLFAGVALSIACLGLLGLVSFAVTHRTREIGVRRVLGASVANVTILLSNELTWLVLIANVIAGPLGWYVLHNWLENFAYRIDLELGAFALSGALSLVVALVIVATRATRAALANPVETLRYE